MELRHLRYYIAVAEEQNISRAAVRLHVSQPPLSRQIRGLEDELGVALLERIGKRVRLTEAGRSFLVKARRIVCDADTAVQQLREEFSQATRTLRIGFITPFLDDLVAPTVRDFRRLHPKLKVSLFELSPAAQIDRLGRRELDAAILGNIGESERSQFRIQSIWKGKMLMVLPEDHALAPRRSLKLATLADEPWVSLAEAFFPGRRGFLQGLCRAAGFEPRIVNEADSIPLMFASVAAGEGVAVLPAHAAKIPHAGCVLVPFTSRAPVTELLLVRPSTDDPPLAAFARLLSSRAARLAVA